MAYLLWGDLEVVGGPILSKRECPWPWISCRDF